MDRFEEVKLRIKEGVDLVALVEEYVPLKSRGRYHIGLCPFHQEKTPSFTVYSDTQHFKCYGCGKGGDVFTFLMERDGLDFREALEQLAARLGLDTKGVFQGGGRKTKAQNDAHEVLAKVRDWFCFSLQAAGGAAARSYLEDRGLAAASDGFHLGFHPDGRQMSAFVDAKGLPRRVLEEAGLLGDDGYERFAGRLMFPILDERGRVVGFGGRILQADTEKAKYLNSPESPFFNKRKLLFGLQKVKQSGERRLVVMEGYTDVLAAHLAGFTGAVATLGTSLTTDHARLLERYASDGVVLVFDGDPAGRRAADRAFRELVHTRLPVRIALLDEGVDPADLVSAAPGVDAADLAAGRDAFGAILDQADDALTVWFRLLHQRLDLTLDANVERAAIECGRILQGVEEPVRREALGRRMAQHLGLQEAVFLRTVSRRNPPRRRRPAAAPVDSLVASGDGSDPVWEAARSAGGSHRAAGPGGSLAAGPAGIGPVAELDLDLVACLLAGPELVHEIDSTWETTLPGAAEILEFLRAGVAQGSRSKDAIVGYLFTRCAERPELSNLVATCLDRSAHIKSPTDTLSVLRKDRSAHKTRNQAQHIRYQLQQARAEGDQARVDALTQEYLEQLRSRSAGPSS